MSAARYLQTLGGLEPAFARIAADRLGHDLGGAFAERLAPAVVRAAENVAERDLARFLERVDARDPTAEQAFVEALTVGETYFFRDPKHFDVLRQRLVDRRESKTTGRLRLWSAGCATGEEPYSMAILALETLGDAASAFVEILATDVNADFLRRARLGVYGEWSFRGTPAAMRATWFERAGRRYRVKPAVRSLVTFGQLNLARTGEIEPGPTEVDVAFCRNVLVYFGRDAIGTTQRRFAGALRVGGELVPGPSDPLLDAPNLELDLARGFVTYRRVLAGTRHESGTVRAAPPSPSSSPSSPVERPRMLPRRSPPRRKVPAPSIPPPTASLEDAISRAQALAAKGRIPDALVLLGELIARDRLAAPAYVARATLCLAVDDPKGALADATKANMLDRGLVFAHVVLATASARLGDVGGVDRACRAARKMLAAMRGDAVVPFAGGATAADLFATCRDIERAVRTQSRGGG